MFPEQNHPYESWGTLRQNKPLSTQTQNDVYVRDELSSENFALIENRVNLGPYYQYRKEYADLSPQIPMDYGTPDMWGWEDWVKNRKIVSKSPTPRAPQLYTATPITSAFRSCSSCRRPRK